MEFPHEYDFRPKAPAPFDDDKMDLYHPRPQQPYPYHALAPVEHQLARKPKRIKPFTKDDREIVKPRIKTFYWEDKKTVCFQVQSNGLVVSRREKDNYVNGTKLLNATGITRGRRDALLKLERGREVVKMGPMCLKGVWIPFEKAAELARNEGVYQLLFPLFVENIRDFYDNSGLELQEHSEFTDDELEIAPAPQFPHEVMPKQPMGQVYNGLVNQPNTNVMPYNYY